MSEGKAVTGLCHNSRSSNSDNNDDDDDNKYDYNVIIIRGSIYWALTIC